MRYLGSAMNFALALCAGLVVGGFVWPEQQRIISHMYYTTMCLTYDDARKYVQYLFSARYSEEDALEQVNSEAGKISCREYPVVSVEPRSVQRAGRFSEIFKSGSIYALEASEIPLAFFRSIHVERQKIQELKLYMIEPNPPPQRPKSMSLREIIDNNPRSR